jgi:hypothetical protein
MLVYSGVIYRDILDGPRRAVFDLIPVFFSKRTLVIGRKQLRCMSPQSGTIGGRHTSADMT